MRSGENIDTASEGQGAVHIASDWRAGSLVVVAGEDVVPAGAAQVLRQVVQQRRSVTSRLGKVTVVNVE